MGDLALRQGHPQAAALGIDRCREWHVLQRLRGLGIGPEPLRFDRQRDLAAFTWLPGRSGAPEAAAARALLRRLHDVPRCGEGFSPAAMLGRYREWLGAGLDPALGELSRRCEQTSQALEETAELRLCHNDCVAKNWLQLDDGGVRLIDFEFAGDNDPAFDFATLSLDVELSPLPERVLAYRPVVDCLWTLYCLVLAELDETKREAAQRQAGERCKRLGIRLEHSRR